jgi:hypothetical protein
VTKLKIWTVCVDESWARGNSIPRWSSGCLLLLAFTLGCQYHDIPVASNAHEIHVHHPQYRQPFRVLPPCVLAVVNQDLLSMVAGIEPPKNLKRLTQRCPTPPRPCMTHSTSRGAFHGLLDFPNRSCTRLRAMRPCLHFPRGSTASLSRIQLLEGDPGHVETMRSSAGPCPAMNLTSMRWDEIPLVCSRPAPCPIHPSIHPSFPMSRT